MAALYVNSIGAVVFIDLQGQPDFVKTRATLIQRPGITGSAVKYSADACPPFVLQSVEDLAIGLAASPLSVARSRLAAYESLIGGGALALVFQGQALGNVAVLGVEAVDMFGVSCLVGGQNVANGNQAGILVARWQLVFL